MKPIIAPFESPATLNILGIPMTIRVHGRDTGRVVSVVEFGGKIRTVVPAAGRVTHTQKRLREQPTAHGDRIPVRELT